MDRSELEEKAVVGCLLGTAYGDALGLPYEGLHPARAARLLGAPSRYRFFLGRGMVSDDTEHAVMVALALCHARLDPDRFSRELARNLRLWLAAIPAGIGFATLRATLKLMIGFPPSASGVFSAGNGPAMRAPLIGVVAPDKRQLLLLTKASTEITHTDPKAYYGAVAVALAARVAQRGVTVDPWGFLSQLKTLLGSEATELLELISRCIESLEAGCASDEFARQLDLEGGVSGYVYHTVPVCIHAWLRNQNDLPGAVEAVIACGGDTDTTAAIVGGIIGARVGLDGIPARFRDGILDWPWHAEGLARLGHVLARFSGGDRSTKPPRPLWLLRFPRNLFFFAIVLVHIVRRALPPY